VILEREQRRKKLIPKHQTRTEETLFYPQSHHCTSRTREKERERENVKDMGSVGSEMSVYSEEYSIRRGISRQNEI
jgi:hypothetical protein